MNKYLIHVGYPKSGSCFLGEWFHRHPSFVFEDFKFAGFKSTSDFCKFALSERTQVKYFVIRDMIFSCPIINELKGVSNINEYQEKICKTLNEFYPDSKILIVTRGFESALISNYCQYVKEGGTLTFKERLLGNVQINWIIYNYTFLIELYCQYFGKENVIVVPYELLKENSNAFLKYIEEKLNIPTNDFVMGSVNASLPLNIVYSLRMLNISIHKFAKITGKSGRFLLKLYLKNLDSKKTTSKNRFILTKLLSFFYKNKQDDTNIPLDLIPKELLLIFEKFGTVLKDYAIFEKYYEKYLIKI